MEKVIWKSPTGVVIPTLRDVFLQRRCHGFQKPMGWYYTPRSMPTNPLGLAFGPLTNPWVEKLTQTLTLIE
jgi:hypothetical protein